MTRPGSALLLAAALLLPSGVDAQGFGRNQVRVRDFDWKVTSTKHFDIHYYEDSEPLVPFAARVLERSYARMSRELEVEFDERRPFFLYASVHDMQQSNIVAVGDGTGGVTEAFKDRFMVYHDGSMRWLDEVTTHELAHVFQYRILISGVWRSGRILKTLVYPLWMMEGMAEHFAEGAGEAPGEVLIRDAATSDGLIPLWKLEHFSHLKPHQVRLAYESGGKVMRFLEEEYGRGTVARMIKKWESSFETSSVLQDIVGLDVFKFDKKWREYEGERYARIVRERSLKEPLAYGKKLTGSDKNLPEVNTTPVFTPDGSGMAYLSTSRGFPASVMLKDLKTGKVRALVSHDSRIETLPMGNFANNSRVLGMSPDGGLLAFAGARNHRDSIYLYDLGRGRTKRVPVKGMEAVTAPAFSPDGGSVAFSGMRDAVTDIYVMDLGTRKVRRLTSDPADDQGPNFSPDGRWIVYSSEWKNEHGEYGRRLYRVGVEDGTVERVSDNPGSAWDPVHSADGKRVLYSLEHEDFQEIHELELASGSMRRLTRSIGAAYTPTYTPAGGIAFSGLRKGSVHIYSGPRDGFGGAADAAERPREERVEEEDVEVPVSTAPVSRTPGRPAESPFSTDLFLPAFFFSSNGGMFWTSYWQGSDLLGNHQALSFVSYASGLGLLDYQTVYSYNRLRTKLRFGGVGRWRRETFDEASGLTLNEFSHSEFAGATYPLDRFHRLDFVAATLSDQHSFLDTDTLSRREARVGAASLIRDTVRGRYLVATGGSRLRATYLAAPRILGGNFTYQSVSGEAHKYVGTGGLSALVLRGVGVASWGATTPQFVLGGIGGVRGFARSTVQDFGSRLALGTAEWRVPVFSNLDYYMWYIFPDFYFKAVSLTLFTDAGYAWDSRGELSHARWRDIRHSYGLGLRVHTFILQLFPLVIHFDYARRTTNKGGVFYVYLGPLF